MFDTSKPNMIIFSVSAAPKKTISLKIVPAGSFTSYKMLIKTGQKPTLDEIVTDGFLYPEEIKYEQFAKFNYIKTTYQSTSPDAMGTVYLTYNSSLSTEVYYVGLTLDLNHTSTVEMLKQDYLTCSDGNETVCIDVVNVTIDIQTQQLGCLYWDEKSETWSSQGCEVIFTDSHDCVFFLFIPQLKGLGDIAFNLAFVHPSVDTFLCTP